MSDDVSEIERRWKALTDMAQVERYSCQPTTFEGHPALFVEFHFGEMRAFFDSQKQVDHTFTNYRLRICHTYDAVGQNGRMIISAI